MKKAGPINKMVDINLQRRCSYLLPDPGGEVVRGLLDELSQQRQKHLDLKDFVYGVREIARDRNPKGVTILDFMSVWNEQYEDRIKKQQNEIDRLEAKFTGRLDQSPLEMIRAKCEQYWNDPVTLCPEEWHSILEFIHRLARSAEEN